MTTANPLASGSHQPVAIVEIIDKIELIAKESLLWGLLWSCTSVAVWYIWRERNKKWHANERRTGTALATSLLAEFKLSFREMKLKASHRRHSEAEC